MLAGRTQIATIEGEPGIGKTRLAKEFLKWARAQGADVLEARAFETGESSALSTTGRGVALSPGGRASTSRNCSAMSGWLNWPGYCLNSESRSQSCPLHCLLGEAEARTRLFEAVARLGHALARRAPLVLFIDDAQWADAASLDVLQYASRRWAAAHLPVFVLCTFRSDDLASNVALAEWLTNLERTLPVRRQTLISLTFEETLRLVESLFGAEKGTSEHGDKGQAQKVGSIEAWGRWLFAETRGYPFFLIEYLKLLAEQRELLRDEARTVLIPSDWVHAPRSSAIPPPGERTGLHSCTLNAAEPYCTYPVYGRGCAR